ncbi:hypothetical protein ACU4GD_12305 [Cupriavidus basilensis]
MVATVSSQRATINAQARYTRLLGQASFQGKGVLGYAGPAIRGGRRAAWRDPQFQPGPGDT